MESQVPGKLMDEGIADPFNRVLICRLREGLFGLLGVKSSRTGNSATLVSTYPMSRHASDFVESNSER